MARQFSVGRRFIAVDRQQRLQLLEMVMCLIVYIVPSGARRASRHPHRRAARQADRCPPRPRTRPRAVAGRRTAAGHLPEDQSEPGVEAQIDGEVGGRVDDDQKVADASEVELQAAAVARLVGQQGPHELSDEGRGLADGEHEHDDHQHQGDVAVLRRRRRPLRTLHLGPLAAQGGQGADETNVEAAERDQGRGQHQDGVEDVVVDDAVHLAVAEPRVAGLCPVYDVARRRTVDCHRVEISLTEPRHVVEQNERQNQAELKFGLSYCAQTSRLHVTDIDKYM